MIYYTSDLHFGQKSLLATGKWKERPFETLEEMHAAQIKRWNDKVTNGDDIYIAGDVGARGYHNMFPELLAQLKGRKHLILGNHDDVSDLRVRQQFVEIVNYKELTDFCKGKKGKGNKVKRFVMHDGIVYTSDMKTLVAGLPFKKEVVIPEGVMEIHANAFYRCNIESVTMPDSLEVIDTCAFHECKNLSTVKFGNGLTRICERAFFYCKNLKEIVLPDRLERMDSYAFSYAGLESVTFGSGLNSLSNGVFANTPMQKVHIPNTVTRIAHCVFGEDIKSIIADNYIQDIESVASCINRRNADDFVIISCDGKKTYIPKNVKPSMFDTLKSRASFFWSDEGEETCGFWDCSYSAKGREDEALAEYLEFGFIDAKEYLKKNSKRIITRLVEEGDEDKIVQFLNLGFVSKPTLKSLIPKAEEKELTIVSSYILKQIGDKKTSNRFAL